MLQHQRRTKKGILNFDAWSATLMAPQMRASIVFGFSVFAFLAISSSSHPVFNELFRNSCLSISITWRRCCETFFVFVTSEEAKKAKVLFPESLSGQGVSL
jgi:hypothetical protein